MASRARQDVKSLAGKDRFSLSQNERRKQMLKKLREKQETKLDQIRQLAMDDEEAPMSDQQTAPTSEGSQDTMTDDDQQPQRPTHRNHLMQHELLEELPADFATDWICVPVPTGERCLVIASCARTYARSVEGKMLEKFTSALPSGSPSTRDGRKQSYCLFDCIYRADSRTFYVLDMMCWKAHLYYDSDTQFRFFFLHSKLSEHPEVMEISPNNPYRFIPLEAFNCNRQGIQSALNPAQIGFQPDVLTFYNKCTHYTPHETNPLVCYLPLSQVESLVAQLPM